MTCLALKAVMFLLLPENWILVVSGILCKSSLNYHMGSPGIKCLWDAGFRRLRDFYERLL